MKQFLSNIENKYPFITSILISIGIIMWFRGLIGLIDIILVKEKNKLLSYFALMILALIIFYITNVGTGVIFDIEQRRKVNNLLNQDENLLEEDKHFLIDKSDNHHVHTSTVLYPTVHSL
jgi:hypothetical protein